MVGGGRLLGLKDVVPADSWHSDYAIAILLTLCRLQEARAPPPRAPPRPARVVRGLQCARSCADARSAHSGRQASPGPFSSRLHESVSAALTSMGVKHINEFAVFGGVAARPLPRRWAVGRWARPPQSPAHVEREIVAAPLKLLRHPKP